MIPPLSAGDYGMLASGLYSIFTFVTWVHPDIPKEVGIRFFLATVFLLFVSKSPVVTYFLDASEAKELGFVIAIVVGVTAFAVAWYRGHFHDCRDHSPEPLDDEDDNE